MKTGLVKAILYLRAQWNFHPYFQFPMWVKFRLRDLHKMLFTIYEFCEIWARKAILFLSAYMKIHSRVYNAMV
jgi:hypothetical protein